ncbi:DUF2971 domain-containing protein [Bradyrhizobium sp. C-145]|uniref:DUF2971 domain-containing protein n=1 Tax=Bradyrhizobium sp. C-145 TaxID=574727 RepID=UPI00201B7344|nr:DUF2971 domain-containing protein [Bradyrhizobium sp. C-145]UQR61186.1 DUF2971 domain-containing protein [Bradyrhizobium sp. C-145]
MTTPSPTNMLHSPLQKAIDSFAEWRDKHLQIEQDTSAITTPLYHYTNADGFKGILESGSIWFTDYRHLNDPTELLHGINLSHVAAQKIAAGADGRVRLFLECLADMFRRDNFTGALEFFITCFSRARDDLGQWRAYADNGRGVAIGFSPSLFAITAHPPLGRLPEFVGSVHYADAEIVSRHSLHLRKAAELFLAAANANRNMLADRAIGIPFMQDFARELIASPLIWNCLTSKHSGYIHEQEVRLVIMGTLSALSSHIKTRSRAGGTLRYIAQPIQIRAPRMIKEIVIGPAAPPDAERNIRAFLVTLGIDQDVEIVRSAIPYRVS